MRPVPLMMTLLLSSSLAWAESALSNPNGAALDETGYWRKYYRFGVDLVSPAALRAEGQKLLGPVQFQRVRASTEKSLTQSETVFAVFHPSAAILKRARIVGTEKAFEEPPALGAAPNWTDYVFVRTFYDPYTAPPPPADWADAAFDDSPWVLSRGLFQADMADDLPPEMTAGNMAKVHLDALQYVFGGVQSCYYRSRFVVDEPSKVGALTLRLVYRGGARAFLNGKEIARGHLPQGDLAPDAPGDDYPLAAYDKPELRDRALGPVTIAPGLVRQGVNVLAVEVRASLLHPIVVAKQASRSWNAFHDREGLWRHVHLGKVELRSASAAGSPALSLSKSLWVWVQDIHHRADSTEVLPPGETAGTVRIVGAQNGTYSAQVTVGADRDITAVQIVPSALKQVGGVAELPPSTIQVFAMAPYPSDEFAMKRLGDERGLAASFPDMPQLSRLENMSASGKSHIFDHITAAASARIPAGTSRPFWLSFRIPADAAPGTYRGSLAVKTSATDAASVAVEVEVVGWRLPEPRQFRTFVACEENPYAVAKQYNVTLWSDEHFRLLEASFKEMARAGNTWLNVPVLRRTEFGNRDDSMIRWVRIRDGSVAFDYGVLDKYLDLAVKHWGVPRVINFIVMHGMAAGLQPPLAPEVNVFDEAAGKITAIPVGGANVAPQQKQALWNNFATSLYAHMKGRGLDKTMYWGYPLDREEDPELRRILAQSVPDVFWTAGPHQIGASGFKEPQQYKIFGTVRYFNNWPTFRMNMGWRSPVIHLAIPRVDSSVLSVHTTSYPFAYRVFVDHALALGRAGICRVGADEWAATHYDGMRIPTWIVGMPVLYTLWPGPTGAESSARFEALIEGIQESEARIFLEQALDRGGLPNDLAQRAARVLAQHFLETSFFQNKLCLYEFEKYYYRWQERSRRLYQTAAEVAKVQQSGAR